MPRHNKNNNNSNNNSNNGNQSNDKNQNNSGKNNGATIQVNYALATGLVTLYLDMSETPAFTVSDTTKFIELNQGLISAGYKNKESFFNPLTGEVTVMFVSSN